MFVDPKSPMQPGIFEGFDTIDISRNAVQNDPNSYVSILRWFNKCQSQLLSQCKAHLLAVSGQVSQALCKKLVQLTRMTRLVMITVPELVGDDKKAHSDVRINS
jgi:hypothetical protein